MELLKAKENVKIMDSFLFRCETPQKNFSLEIINHFLQQNTRTNRVVKSCLVGQENNSENGTTRKGKRLFELCKTILKL